MVCYAAAVLHFTISRIHRPLDKTLGLGGLRKRTRPKTAKQRQSEVKKQFERRKKRFARRSSSRLEVAVFYICTHCGHFFSCQRLSRRNEEAEEREAPKRRKKNAETEKPQRKRSR